VAAGSSGRRLDVLLSLDRRDPAVDTPLLFDIGGVPVLGDRGRDDRREDDDGDEERELRPVDDAGGETEQRRDGPDVRPVLMSSVVKAACRGA
jgi:hypothetical protein